MKQGSRLAVRMRKCSTTSAEASVAAENWLCDAFACLRFEEAGAPERKDFPLPDFRFLVG